jgi:hypothetical protein
MPTVYLETTIPSYLAAHPSRDLIIAAHQQITHDWWRHAGDRFDLYISEAVCRNHPKETMMINDPIVEDVYQARQKILDQCNGDLGKWIQRLKAAETQHQDRLVTLDTVREKRRLGASRQTTKP